MVKKGINLSGIVQSISVKNPGNVSFRMIKVLMELANKHEALKNLTEKMAVFGTSIHLLESTKSSTETSHSESLLI